MAFCYPDECGEYTVAPMLVSSPCYMTKCSEEPSLFYPCLPACPKGQKVYCCERRAPEVRSRAPTCDDHDDCEPNYLPSGDRLYPKRKPLSSPPRQPQNPPQHRCETCNQPACKPVKTKYVMPCYRYEDGRIDNQPTVLMRRACEVAVGARMRRKPFVESSFCADPYNEEHRYHSEDERGNCCFHYERKKPTPHCYPDHRSLQARSVCSVQHHFPWQTDPPGAQCHYVDYVQAKVAGPYTSCYLCN